jgi:hypothetical protein
MKMPTYSVKEMIHLVEQSETTAFLNRVYDIFEKELDKYPALEAQSLKFMMACKSMALTLKKAVRIY